MGKKIKFLGFEIQGKINKVRLNLIDYKFKLINYIEGSLNVLTIDF